MYLLNRIRITRYNKIHYKESYNDKRIDYCKNRGLIYAITLIGHFYGKDPKKSAYKTALSIFKKSLTKKRICQKFQKLK